MAVVFSDRLLRWFDIHGRKDLPWQRDISPYRVWVSEIMLQQTQVATVIPYFEKFMHRFPTVDKLACASEDEVLHLWTGLGYYARARNLHKSAKIVLQDHQGALPDSLESLRALPGIGRSTAGAIISIACQRRAVILDGNVKRVLSRYLGIEGWPGKSSVANQLWAGAEALTPDTRYGDYSQAIMDLGATVCTRTRPTCETCPLNEDCFALIKQQIDQLPGKKPKTNLPVKSTCMLIVANGDGELLLQKRPSTGVWGGLWSFPECGEHEIESTLERLMVESFKCEALTSFRHTFTHFHLDITPILVKSGTISADQDGARGDLPSVNEAAQKLWYHPDQPLAIGLTGPVTKLISQLSSDSLETGYPLERTTGQTQ